MTTLTADIEQSPPRFERILGSYRGNATGASVVCVAGIHGNEVSGIHALRRVLRVLEDRRPPFRGEFVGIAGNLSALERGDRYLAEDLNRVWTEDRIEAVRELAPDRFTTIEHEEMWGLLSALDDAFTRSRGECYFLDLHTSSAGGGPFVLLGDTIRNRSLAFKIPAPVILGLEETIDGVLLEYVNSLGHVTIGFEAGQHDDPASIDNQESAIWIGLLHAGCIDAGDVPEAVEARRRLNERTHKLPRIMELRYRKPVSPEDHFRMRPGYMNFQPVSAGEVVASDRNGDVAVKETGRLLLPLYQGKGSDGYFLARDVRPFWLFVSSVLRHLHAHHLVRILPGIWHHPTRPDTFVVNRRVARWVPMQVLHLLGFRKVREEGEYLTVSRRRYDLKSPHI
ncbi:MAG: succinylglutamate desuccinylase/aspartoacylase family protein [Phycisphaerales bacterium]|nr:succinylglutamate desuccinylase/aspartoacylase family protein [Phycisphaerales bacterium]MCB9857517.1 succinylglutamate desuccinylase/aspartoacylase family protein [Phycisphaerales bacterium]MCB9864498.1 succinylglutamate desuccinylase/aspartoacylase family protein [Phycisphaerales bacterium]